MSRTRSRSAGRSSRVMPVVSIGSRTRTSATARPIRQSFGRRQSRVPCTAIGRIGCPPSMASLKAPGLNLSRSSVFERRPSGKIITDTLSPRRCAHSWSASTAEFRSSRTSGMSRARRIIHPMNGIFMISFFDNHFISVGRCEMRIMSTKLSWFATTTYGRRMSSGSSPDVRNVHSGLSLLSGITTLRNA